MPKENRRIVYPISANPPTFGHADILVRAAKKFECVYWLSAVNSSKKSQLPGEVQLQMMQDYVRHYGLDNVVVDRFEGSVVRYALKNEAGFILRGVRNQGDLQAEMDLATGYRGISEKIETICFFASPNLAMVSSTLVRELAKVGEDIESYVLPEVAKKLLLHLGSNP